MIKPNLNPTATTALQSTRTHLQNTMGKQQPEEQLTETHTHMYTGTHSHDCESTFFFDHDHWNSDKSAPE